MTSFDPYFKWLAIPAGSARPPDHYTLLGLQRFEADLDVVHNAADARMVYVKSMASGAFAELSQQLLNEISQARVCLCDPRRRRAYDEILRAGEPLVGATNMSRLETREPDFQVAISTQPSRTRRKARGYGMWIAILLARSRRPQSVETVRAIRRRDRSGLF